MDKQTDNEIKREKVRVIPIKYIDGFPNHPFQVKKDKEMEKLMESIKTYGVLTPMSVLIRRAGFPWERWQTVICATNE